MGYVVLANCDGGVNYRFRIEGMGEAESRMPEIEPP